jgi:hypothetical protein
MFYSSQTPVVKNVPEEQVPEVLNFLEAFADLQDIRQQ